MPKPLFRPYIKFWFTDLSVDSGQPWFSCHMELEKFEINECFSSLFFWRLKLIIIGLKKLIRIHS